MYTIKINENNVNAFAKFRTAASCLEKGDSWVRYDGVEAYID